MNTHRDTLTPEEGLSDEQIFNDIQRRMRVATITQEFDARALAVRAVEEYWVGRERGAVDREGNILDDIYLANVMAERKLRNEERSGEAVSVLAVVLPLLGVMLALWLFPSLLNIPAGLSQQGSLVNAAIVLTLACVLIVALVDSRLKERWLENGNVSKHRLMALSVGVLLAATVTLAICQQTERGRRRVAEEQAARRRAEEDKRRAEERLEAFSSQIARATILDHSREVMQEQHKTGSFENSSPSVETLPVGNQKIHLTQQRVSRDAVTYKAEGEPLPKPVVITMNKESGRVIEEGKETERFYAAVVKDTSGDTLTLSVRNEDGSGSDLTWPRGSLAFHPSVGQRLFVVVDPVTNRPTGVTEFEPNIGKNETSRPH